MQAILFESSDCSQCPCSPWSWCIWPKFGCIWSCSHSIETLFHDETNRCHHLMSEQASLLMRIIVLCVRFAWASIAISLPMNDLPGRTTLQAWFKWPKNDSRECLEQTFLNCHSCSSSCSLCHLSCGRWSSMAIVSISIPRNTKHVVGPIVLWGASSIPYSCQVSKMICWLVWHWSVLGAPTMMKSPR